MRRLTALVCPMDWGLGHASRCVPVISAFLKAGFCVVTAVSGPGAELIKKEFGGSGRYEDRFRVVPFPGFVVSYARSFLFLKLLLQVPLFLYHIRKERRVICELAERYNPDIIVSDNRYGLAYESVKSVIITHQLRPSMPSMLKFIEGFAAWLIRRRVRAFDECWIPDDPDNNAAGRLTEGWENLPGACFIGWLSRFNRDDSAGQLSQGSSGSSCPYRVLVILSGPEPHRSILEEIFIGQLKDSGIKALLVRGLPFLPCRRDKTGEAEIVSYLNSADLESAAGDSELIICRSGYSSVMDLLVAGRSALLIPTPGQTEQEYLGRWLSGRGWFRVLNQKDAVGGGLEGLFKEIGSGRSVLQGFFPPDVAGSDLLQERINRLAGELAGTGKH